MKRLTYLLTLVVMTASCSNDDDSTTSEDNSAPPNVVGMSFVESNRSFDDTYNALRNALESNENIAIVAEVNHRSNASSVNLNLNQTRVIFFGNPNLGTPLMNQNPQVAIDLPQRMVVYQDDNEDVYIGYNNVAYLDTRHALNNEVEILTQLNTALTTLASNAGDNTIVMNPEMSQVAISDGFVQDLSNRTFLETYDMLKGAIEANANLRIITEVDHKANATAAGLDLPPTRVIIFGNPNLGTPLMQNAQTTGLDLPQKILVWQNDIGAVQVGYNAPDFLKRRHNITDNDDTLTTISGALESLSNTATGN